MNLFKNFLKINEDNPKSKDKRDNSKGMSNKIQEIMIKAVGKIMPDNTYGRDTFRGSEYNLEEIKDAIDTDSYIKIASLKYSCLIFKSGWKLKADNQKAIDYILKRFKYMSIATGKPMDILFQEIGDDVYKYSNAFLIKARTDSIPGIKATPVLNKKVVAGYFRVDPTTIKIKRDESGNVLKYEQGVGRNKKEFAPDDVIHIYMDRDGNNAFGTPRITAALDDVKLLRKIEGNIVALIHRFSMPTYHWKIGLPTPGLQGTDPEIVKAKREFEASTFDGAFITNEKSEIKAIGTEGGVLNAKPYLEYFEDRVFSALGVSASQMGRGGAKQDSESMEAQVHDTVKYIQRIMSIFIENKMILELLLEGGFDIFDQKNNVRFKFEEISLETKLKKENHEMLKYQSNLITLEEARRNIGIKDEVESEDRLYQNLIIKQSRIDEIKMTAKTQMDLEKLRAKNSMESQERAFEHADKRAERQMRQQEKLRKQNQQQGNNNAPGSNNNSSNKSKNQKAADKNKTQVGRNKPAGTNNAAGKKPRTTKDQGPNGSVKSNNQPKNQYGTHSVKVKESANFSKKTKKQFKDIFKIYEEMRNSVDRNKDNTMLFVMTEEAIKDTLTKYYEKHFIEGVYDATNEINSVYTDEYRLLPNIPIANNTVLSGMGNTIKSLFKDIKKEIKNTDRDETEVIDKFEYRLRFMTDYITRSSYWYAYALTGKYLGIKEAYLIMSEDDAEDREKVINLKTFKEEDIPAFHPYCSCKITYSRKKAGD